MHFINAKSILSSKNGMNIYRGCTHGCIYCDSRSECYQFGHRFEDIAVKQNAPELAWKCARPNAIVTVVKKFDIPYRNALKLKYPPYPWTEHFGGRRMITPPDYVEDRVTHLITFPEFDAWLSTVDYDLTVEVEFKCKGMCPRMDEILAKSENVSKYIFFSGNWEVLEEMQEHYRKNGKPEGLRLGANIRFINEQTMDFVKRSDLWEVGLNNEAFTKEDVEMFESMGIKVFSNLGDYPEWWQQICDMGIAGFKTNYPDAYTEWWLSTC